MADLDSLRFFKSLRVGDLVVEPAKVKARYLLTLPDGETRENELVYSYPDKVFGTDPLSLNLASMMLAQVALNYGLFCEEIIFEGLFDDVDKRFLIDMMENTSREIYVNKFLARNEFLTEPFRGMKADKRKKYTAARVSFQSIVPPDEDLEWYHLDVDRNKYLVLSSGGKDSLLSYGLLKERNKEVLPVFINESGRHWFTASNAYHYLEGTEDASRRVWTNCDRVYNWMLRQMPCIRPNFMDVRADMYPVRLWTVAVFLFGSLPYAVGKGVGNLIIGNEYDTSMRTSTEGITHYSGLYDQSRYFDAALTRYYTKKGWNLFQFSILRTLSELLILKILAKRYPELQAQQISCHAASMDQKRAYPCGKCEKCRRIVSMLSVLDVPPAQCGYTPEQIARAFESMRHSGVKQIGSDAEHLYHLMAQKGLIPANEGNALTARSHHQVMKVRIDPRRSPLNDIPLSLQQELIPIFLEYADGAAIRKKKGWVDVDVFHELENSPPYPFEVSRSATKGGETQSPVSWGSYTWKEMEEQLKEVDTAILPCGSIEQHGPHLPVDIDYYDSMYLSKAVSEACSPPRPLVLPAIPYGVAYHHEDFKGTLSISNHTLSALVHDIGLSLAKNGIKKLIILNAHGDNAPTLLYAAQMINRDTGMFVCVESGETSDTDIDELVDTPNDIHAGEIETSTTMAIRPEVVRMEELVSEPMNFGSKYLDFSSERGVAWYVRTQFISHSGVMGDPRKATPEKGKKIWEIMIAHLVRFVEEVKQSNPEDLYQRKI